MIDNLYLNIGAMKAGTTWLFSHLEHHPDIHFSEEKEVHYFAHVDSYRNPLGDHQRLNGLRDYVGSAIFDSVSFDKYMDKLDWYVNYLRGPVDDVWYERLFSGRRSERYCADFSNLYAHLDGNGWDHVKSVARNLKVTYIMRHPLHRLWSHVKFHTRITGEYEQMLEWNDEQFADMVLKAFIWDNTEYSRVVRSMQENLEPNQMQILFFEDIHTNPKKALRDLEGFLKIGRHAYNDNALSQKVNVSPSISLPVAFEDQFRPKLAAEARELEALGVSLPESWLDLFQEIRQVESED